MGIFDFFRRTKSPSAREWSTSSAYVSIINGASGINRSRANTEILAAWGTSPWFRACVERAAFAAAVVPWQVYATRGAAGKKWVRHVPAQIVSDLSIRKAMLTELKAQGKLVEIVDHKFLRTWANPNPHMTGIDLALITYSSLLVIGEVGWALSIDAQGEPVQFWPVPAPWIVKRPSMSGGSYTVQMGSSTYVFSSEEFVLFKNPAIANPYGGGSGLGSTLADELQSDEYISKFQQTWFESRGRPDLLFMVQPSTGSGRSELERTREQFENRYRDARKGGRSMWVRGNLDVKELSQKLVDLDLTQQRTWLKDLIRQVLGIPPEIMGDIKSSNRATIREARVILSLLSTIPQIERIRAQLQNKVLALYDDRLVLGFIDPTPENRQFQLEAIKTAPWAITRREMRQLQMLEDRGPLDDVYMVPMNFISEPAPKVQAAPSKLMWHELVKGSKAASVVKSLSDEEMDVVIDAIDINRLKTELDPEMRALVRRWGLREAASYTISFNMLDPAVLAHLKESESRLIMINATTQRIINRALAVGVSEGESVQELSRRIRSTVSGMTNARSQSIARTEVNRSANFAIHEAQRQSGVVPQREWLSTLDGNARDVHAALHGHRADIDKPFIMSGYTVMYPGSFGSPEMDINCRCTTVAVIDESKSIDYRAYKAFIDETDNDEKRVVSAIKKAFDRQLADLLQILSSI